MAVQFNHTILSARDAKGSARFLAEMLCLPGPVHWGPFEVVTTENGANLDFIEADGAITPQHYAFLVGDSEFDAIFDRIRAAGVAYRSSPRGSNDMQINRRLGGKNLYWQDPDGHLWEILTVSYARAESPTASA